MCLFNFPVPAREFTQIRKANTSSCIIVTVAASKCHSMETKLMFLSSFWPLCKFTCAPDPRIKELPRRETSASTGGGGGGDGGGRGGAQKIYKQSVLYTLLVRVIITGYIKQIPGREERLQVMSVSDLNVFPVITATATATRDIVLVSARGGGGIDQKWN